VARNFGFDLFGGKMTAEDPGERPSCKEVAMEAGTPLARLRARVIDIPGFIDKIQIYTKKRICKWSCDQKIQTSPESKKADREVRQDSDKVNDILTILSGS